MQQTTECHDEFYMLRAIALARHGRFTTSPNPNVGCVIVHDGEIIGEGYHAHAGEAHAEVYALGMAGEKARGATVYVTLEPCSHYGQTPPCADALIAAGVFRVVVAESDPNPRVAGGGVAKLRQAGIKVDQGVLSQEAEKLNPGFLKRMRTGFPYVQLKLAASLDGRTAMASGESQWITSLAARRDVQRYRAQSSAILTSSATVLADNPALTVRWDELAPEIQQQYPREKLRQPQRVIIDSQHRVRPEHRIITQPGVTWLVHTALDDSQVWPASVTPLIVPCAQGRVDLVALFWLLGKQQINTVWVEAGATLAGVLLQAGLVDELIVYVAPKLLGHAGRGLCVLPGLEHLADALQWRFEEVTPIGEDLRLRLCQG